MSEVPLSPIPEPPARPFSPLAFMGGLLISLFFGAIANVFAILLGGSFHLGLVAGLLPGAIFIGISRLLDKGGFAQGLLVGGCIIALIGGICGGAMNGPLDFK